MVYLPTFGCFFGKYTSPIDPMGKETRVMAEASSLWRQCLFVKKTLASPSYQLENLFCLATLKNRKHIFIPPNKKEAHQIIHIYINNININKKHSLTPMSSPLCSFSSFSSVVFLFSGISSVFTDHSSEEVEDDAKAFRDGCSRGGWRWESFCEM